MKTPWSRMQKPTLDYGREERKQLKITRQKNYLLPPKAIQDQQVPKHP